MSFVAVVAIVNSCLRLSSSMFYVSSVVLSSCTLVFSFPFQLGDLALWEGGYCKNPAWLAFRCLDWEIGLVHLHGYIP